MNIDKNISDDDLITVLEKIISEYELEFKNDFSSIFLYTYYTNFNQKLWPNLLQYIKTRKPMDNANQKYLIQSERNICQESLIAYNMQYTKYFYSKITNRSYSINYQAQEIIENSNFFIRPGFGDPTLRGPHQVKTIDYSLEYWTKYQEQATEYIENFKQNKTEDYLLDLADYQQWLKKYNQLLIILAQKKQAESIHR
jgi:hypothetical protein